MLKPRIRINYHSKPHITGQHRKLYDDKNCANDYSILHYPCIPFFLLTIILWELTYSYPMLSHLAKLDSLYCSNPYDMASILNQVCLEMPLVLQTHQIGDECQHKLKLCLSYTFLWQFNLESSIFFLCLHPHATQVSIFSAPGITSPKARFVALVPDMGILGFTLSHFV